MRGSPLLRLRYFKNDATEVPHFWLNADPTATGAGIPNPNINKGVRRKPPPIPNIPAMYPMNNPATASKVSDTG
jgi:hypothetical protein